MLAGEAKKLKDKDIEIGVNDENNIDIIRNGDPDDYPTFSCLYNKAEMGNFFWPPKIERKIEGKNVKMCF